MRLLKVKKAAAKSLRIRKSSWGSLPRKTRTTFMPIGWKSLTCSTCGCWRVTSTCSQRHTSRMSWPLTLWTWSISASLSSHSCLNSISVTPFKKCKSNRIYTISTSEILNVISNRSKMKIILAICWTVSLTWLHLGRWHPFKKKLYLKTWWIHLKWIWCKEQGFRVMTTEDS